MRFADKIEGPYEVRVVSEKDHQGYLKGLTLHQGGIIQTPLGEWWGYSMQDRDGIGRMTNLAPVTWHEGFPYFGLPGMSCPEIVLQDRTYKPLMIIKCLGP